MKKQFLFATLALATMFTACSKEEELSKNEGGTPVNFVIGGIGARTVTTLGQDGAYSTVFKADDEIGIYASGGADITNSKYTVVEENSAQSLNGATISYQEGVETSFVAYYPYDNNGGETVTMTVGNQATGIDAYDFVTAAPAAITTGSEVTLTFQHKLAMVQVQVAGEIGENATSVTLKNVKPIVTWTAATNSVQTSGNATDITMYRIDEANNIYVALVPVQDIQSTAMFSTTIGTKTYIFTPKNTVSLTANKVSKFKIEIGETATMTEVSTVNFSIGGWDVTATEVGNDSFEMSEETIPAIELISSAAGTVSENTILNTATALTDITSEGWWSLLIGGTNASTIGKSSDNTSFELNIATEGWNNRCLVYRVAADKIESSTSKKFTLSLNAKMTSGTQVRVSARQVGSNNFFSIGVDTSIAKNLTVGTDYAESNLTPFDIDFNKFTNSTSNLSSESWSATENSQLDDVIIMITSNATNTTVNVKDITLIEVQE